MPEPQTVRVNGELVRCQCGSNLFTPETNYKNKTTFVCAGCGVRYVGVWK